MSIIFVVRVPSGFGADSTSTKKPLTLLFAERVDIRLVSGLLEETVS